MRLGDGFSYVDGGVTRTTTGNTDGVSATITGPSGRCIVVSTTGPTAIRSSNGPWLHDGDQGWRRELAGQEELTVKCANRAAAETILDRIQVRAR